MILSTIPPLVVGVGEPAPPPLAPLPGRAR